MSVAAKKTKFPNACPVRLLLADRTRLGSLVSFVAYHDLSCIVLTPLLTGLRRDYRTIRSVLYCSRRDLLQCWTFAVSIMNIDVRRSRHYREHPSKDQLLKRKMSLGLSVRMMATALSLLPFSLYEVGGRVNAVEFGTHTLEEHSLGVPNV